MIKIIDAICGAGKTSYAIQMINENPEKKYIYITPFLKETERIKQQCPMANFSMPTQLGEGKFGHFHKLLIKGENIVASHALFRMATQETKELIEGNGYTLVLDEVMDVLEELPLKKDDLPTIINNCYAHIDDNGFLVWDMEEYDGRYNDIKVMCENKSLFVVNNCVLMWTFPVEVFQSFKEVYILTYMFDAQIQRYYYDMFNVEYEYLKVVKDGSKYSVVPHDFAKDIIVSKVNIYDGKLNDIGDDSYTLSKSWYEKHKYTKVKIMKNNVYNYFFNITKSKSQDNLWTTWKEHKPKVKGKGYSNGYAPTNARATNDFKDRTNIAYTINKFTTPMLVSFFASKGISIDQDRYALSELIQFIFRSGLRDGKDVNIYIPSERMRRLLKDHLTTS